MVLVNQGKNFSLVGKMLVSSPYMEVDNCFAKSVIYILTHDSGGALGVIVNRFITSVKADFLFKALDLNIDTSIFNPSIYFGGPVECDKGLVIHSNDYKNKPLLHIENNLVLSSNLDILKDIASGSGPKSNLVALGHTGWAPGQIEKEIKAGFWIVVEYSHDLVFSKSNNDKWKGAINSLGIMVSNFSSVCGNS